LSSTTGQLRQRARFPKPSALVLKRGQNSITYDAGDGVTPGRSSSAISGVPGSTVTPIRSPAATFNSVGSETATGLKSISGQPELMADGKQELLYMGGEYCPFCGAERWAIVAALSGFGTLSGLHFIHSSPTDVTAAVCKLTKGQPGNICTSAGVRAANGSI
jgi:Domain of unknown function (DUF929)